MQKSTLLSFSLFFFFLGFTQTNAQTMGLTELEDGSLEGYTFFSPFSGTKAYLVDQCGHLVNEWDRGTRPGLAAYFLENGLMLRTYKADLVGPFTSASNAGGLELVDWDNNTVWSYEVNTATQLSHHDAVYMPNGNILVLTWELVFEAELIELGRDPNEIAQEGYMWSERILELEPVGNNDANIIWEWQIKDHYIQDFDDTKLNFGVVSEHPELFNINLPDLNSSNSNSSRDWNHFNAIDYNPALDQILISVRNSDEIWILDHSTTTAEAATHSGGLYGKGGDILYRWGNASAYDRGPVSGQKLFGQHGTHWIRDGLTDAGKILIFNNGNGRPGPDFSTAEIISPPQDANGGYIVPATEPYGPDDSEWEYGDQPSEDFYSAFLSNAQRLPNGNTLLNAGSPGTIFEIDPSKNKAWEYIIPLFGDTPGIQGQNINNNSNFRAYKYAPDFPGFEGLDLTAGESIEIGENPLECTFIISSTENESLVEMEINYQPSSGTIQIHNPQLQQASFSLVNLMGRQLMNLTIHDLMQTVEVPTQLTGIYFVHIKTPDGGLYTEKIFLK